MLHKLCHFYFLIYFPVIVIIVVSLIILLGDLAIIQHKKGVNGKSY